MKPNDSQLHSWLALSLLPGIGTVTARKLVAFFGNAAAVLGANEKQLQEIGGLRQQTIAAIRNGGAWQSAEEEILRCRKMGIVILSLFDEDYPPLLAQCQDAPLQLFVLGDVKALHRNAIAIVGARAATSYGQQMAFRFARELAEQNFVVISGLALGIDSAAHQGCLDADGKTVAVLGCGLDTEYPPQNKQLFHRIVRQGAVVSEYPLGTKPDSFRFPARNRIISGLARGVLVVEAAKRSGSLITAQQALEQNREVFAIPGRIDSYKSVGTHAILQQGAKLVYSVNDILEEFPAPLFKDGGHGPIRRMGNAKPPLLDEREKCIFDLLDVYPVYIDSLIRQSGISAQQVSETLLLLEMKGIVEALPGKQFRRLT